MPNTIEARNGGGKEGGGRGKRQTNITAEGDNLMIFDINGMFAKFLFHKKNRSLIFVELYPVDKRIFTIGIPVAILGVLAIVLALYFWYRKIKIEALSRDSMLKNTTKHLTAKHDDK